MSDYCDRITLRSETHGVEVTVEREFEHHMGASNVYFRCAPPIAGVGDFQTTNGYAFLSDDADHLFLCDSGVCLHVALSTLAVAHIVAPPKAYFSGLRCDGDCVRGDIYRPHQGQFEPMPAISFAKLGDHFKSGYGPVRNGRFPSACDV